MSKVLNFSFCGKTDVRVAAEGGRGMRVQLLTDGRSGRLSGPGGVCKVKCMEGQSSSTSSPPTGDNVLERISLEDYPLAQCNDKTAAVYYR